VEKVGGDDWGGGNHGNNLYSDSLVAVDVLTGKMKWFRQLVHHDIWDYDIAAASALIEVRRNGKVIPAVVQQTKMALLFIFDRETGEPTSASRSGRSRRPRRQANGRRHAAVPGQAGASRAQLDEAVGAGKGHAAARGLLSGSVGTVQAV
jgi:glucose dehydrogenase